MDTTISSCEVGNRVKPCFRDIQGGRMNRAIQVVDTLDSVIELVHSFHGSYRTIIFEAHKLGQQPNQFLRTFYRHVDQAYFNIVLNVSNRTDLIGMVVLAEVTNIHRSPFRNVTTIFTNCVSLYPEAPPPIQLLDGPSVYNSANNLAEGARIKVFAHRMINNPSRFVCTLEGGPYLVHIQVNRVIGGTNSSYIQACIESVTYNGTTMAIQAAFVKLLPFFAQPLPPPVLQYSPPPVMPFSPAPAAPFQRAPNPAAQRTGPASLSTNSVGSVDSEETANVGRGLDSSALRRLGSEEDSHLEMDAWRRECARMGYTQQALQAAYPKVHAFWKRIADVMAAEPRRCAGKLYSFSNIISLTAYDSLLFYCRCAFIAASTDRLQSLCRYLPDWMGPLYVENNDDRICMRLNGCGRDGYGYGCRGHCLFIHKCILCNRAEHGIFQFEVVNEGNRRNFKCEHYRQYNVELDTMQAEGGWTMFGRPFQEARIQELFAPDTLFRSQCRSATRRL
jgi:hypothetical protein